MNINKIYPATFTTKKGKKIIIRLPLESDLGELYRFINDLVDEDTTILMNKRVSLKEEEKYLSGILKEIGEKNGFNLLAFFKEKLVANVGINRKKYRQDFVGGLGISVSKEFREEGLGFELMRQAISLSKNFLKLKMLILSTFAINKRAIHLYEKVGFKKCGSWPKGLLYKGKYIDDKLMYLNLDQSKRH